MYEFLGIFTLPRSTSLMSAALPSGESFTSDTVPTSTPRTVTPVPLVRPNASRICALRVSLAPKPSGPAMKLMP